MTATFGKLEHETLTLKPGLNVIEAPNEWGKSTWCAFIVAMLYGIDTRAKTTKTVLADKTRYAPWSGIPMEGRMDLCWNGKDITIERRTKGRLIFGDFRAYETNTGLDVSELTAANCGMQLLGVEQSVFTRAGFIRMSDLPVTQDDALRRRLNNLVTTGDENGAGEKLAQKLKDLKNKCRFNRTGLLPQAEAKAESLEQRLRDLQELSGQATRLRVRQQELEERIDQLQNHKQTLAYEQVMEQTRHIRQAECRLDESAERLKKLEAECAELPSEEETERGMAQLQRLQNEGMSLQMEQQMQPPAPEQPEIPERYVGMSGLQAITRAQEDGNELTTLQGGQKTGKTMTLIGIVIMVMAALTVVVFRKMAVIIGAVAIAVFGVVMLCIGARKKKKATGRLAALQAHYGCMEPHCWMQDAQNYDASQKQYEAEMERYRRETVEFEHRRETLAEQMRQLTGEIPLADRMAQWDDICRKWKCLRDARRDHQNMLSQVETLRMMKKEVTAPSMPDELTYSQSDTDALLQSAAYEQKQNQLRLGQLQGQAEALGQETALRTQLKQVRGRIAELEDTYLALELAQKALTTATGELQRRFAPRIAKRAQELFGLLTDGRYEKLMLGEDMNVDARAVQEDTLRSSMWRSDGTVDQLYLALRLAVAEELTPDAPLVLDDAMVRFDDVRLKKALGILEQESQKKQVLLFTCQSREKKLQGEA